MTYHLQTQLIEEVNKLELQSKINKHGGYVSVKEHQQNLTKCVADLTEMLFQMTLNSAEDFKTIIRNEKKFIVSID